MYFYPTVFARLDFLCGLVSNDMIFIFSAAVWNIRVYEITTMHIHLQIVQEINKSLCNFADLMIWLQRIDRSHKNISE